MDSNFRTGSVEQPVKASTGLLTTGVVAPEETLSRLREILEKAEDENAFLAASLEFTRVSTSGVAAFLIERNEDTLAIRASSFSSPSGGDGLKAAAVKVAEQYPLAFQGHAPARESTWCIFYATETGNSRRVAESLAERSKAAGLRIELHDLRDYP